MDEGTAGMSSASGDHKGRQDGHQSGTETVAQLEGDIEDIRNHLTDVAGELDRRRHRLFDLPGQARKHAKPIALGTVALAALGLGIWWWRARSRRTIPGRLLSVLPDRVASGEWFDDARKRLAEAIHPTPASRPIRAGLLKISTAGAAAAASVLGKRLAGQLARAQWPGPEDQERDRDAAVR